ncbi:MAG: hypothetical protein ACOYBL_04220 [Lachnospiraceae bacterium]
MDNVIGYDDYEKDFKRAALPEYRWLAEDMLLQALETCELQEALEVHMPDYISNDGCGYTFQFQTQASGNAENGGVLIFYMDFY